MKKNTRNFLVLAGSLAVLGLVYGGARLINYTVEKSNEKKESEEEAANTFYLSEMEQPLKLTFTNESGTYSFTYDSAGETWSYDGDEHFPVAQSYLTTLAGDMKSLKAERKLDEVDEDRSLYGLDEPSEVITVKDDDTEITVNIGDKNSYSGDYYAEVEGSDDVYTISSSLYTAAGYSLDDLLDKEAFPTISSSNISKISLSESDNETSFSKEVTMEPATEEETEEASSEDDSSSAPDASEGESTAETKDSSNESEYEEEGSTEETTEELVEVTTWTRTDSNGDEVLEDTTDLETALTNITSLEFADCADYYADETELSEYGFGENDSVKTLTIVYTSLDDDVTLTLSIGGQDEDGSCYYVKMDDSDAINTVDAASIDTILEFFK